jgi:hypothetical protein
MRKIVFIGFTVISLIACKKESNNSVTGKIYFTGITERDVTGIPLAVPDTTDWRFDDIWTTKEENLFSIMYNNSNQRINADIELYPNPTTGIFRIHLGNKSNSSRLAIRLVDKDFKVLIKNDSLYSQSISINATDFNGNDTLRLYYKLIDSLNYEYKGHGDILIKK